jgi:hypothetical protein
MRQDEIAAQPQDDRNQLESPEVLPRDPEPALGRAPAAPKQIPSIEAPLAEFSKLRLTPPPDWVKLLLVALCCSAVKDLPNHQLGS